MRAPAATSGHGLLLEPTGRLEADTCGQLRQQLATAFASGITAVTVDLHGITALDTTGMGVLGGAARHLRGTGGSFTVIGASADLATALRINGLGDLIPARKPAHLRVVS